MTGVQVTTNIEEVVSFFSTSKAVAMDIETYPYGANKSQGGLLPIHSRIRCIGFYGKVGQALDNIGEETGIILDLRTKAAYRMLDEEFVSKLQEFLLSHTMLAHNAMFETAHLQRIFQAHGIYKPLNIWCTAIAYSLFKHATTANKEELVKNNLAVCAEDILGIKLDKELQKSDWSQDTLYVEQLKYCLKDAEICYKLMKNILKFLDEKDMINVYMLNVKAQEVLANMRIHGMAIDVDKHNEIIETWSKEVAHYELECYKALNAKRIQEINKDDIIKGFKGEIELDSDFTIENLYKWMKNPSTPKKIATNIKKLLVSPSSVKQKSDYFRETLDEHCLSTWEHSEKSGNLKLDKNTLADKQGAHIAIDMLNKFNKASKLLSTYGTGLKEWVIDGKIYPNFTLGYTGTGRMSGREPNSQNWPRDKTIRSLFTPRATNRKIICADYSQVELRIAAELSQDPVMLDAYQTGKDLHRLIASKLTGKPEKDITDDERQGGKAGNFCLVFAGGAKTLQNYAKIKYAIHMSDDDSVDFVEVYRDLYKILRKWHLETTSKAKQTLEAITPMGKLRKLPEDSFYCASVNTPVQGGAGEVMLSALIRLHKVLQEKDIDAFINNVVHDEIILDVAEEQVEVAKEALIDSMIQGYLDVFPNATTLKGLVGCKVGNNWAEAK